MTVPLVAVRLFNGFATGVTVQNLSSAAATEVTFVYAPSPEYVAAGGDPTPQVRGPYLIPAGESHVHNHRLPGESAAGATGHDLPDGWYGTLRIDSSAEAIHAFVQATSILPVAGDSFMAYNAFVSP